MSDLAIGRPDGQGTLFRARTVALLLAIGIAGFIAMLVLGAYAPDLRSGRNGGAHALSNAVTGYSGLVKLAEATGRHPRILRDPRQFDTEDLLVVTPETGAVDISAALQERITRPTLFILPKWRTVPDADHGGWARYRGLLPLFEPIGVLAPEYRFTMRQYRSGGGLLTSHMDFGRFWAPRPIQTITGLQRDAGKDRRLTPLLTDKSGGIVLARIGEGPLYVLADPDLLNNRGMKQLDQASAALTLLDWMNSTGAGGIAFDVSMNGFGHSRSPLKLLFEPPFLAMTLAIAAALLLTGLHALGRFGPVRPRERAIAFGKAALVDNSALLIRKAGREARLGGRYAAAVRDRAARAFGAPARFRDGALDDYLDALKGRRRFTDLAQAADAATNRHGLLEAAQALHDWQGEKTE
ncbi:DUF4350 domain-containing protein [Sphingobium chlorophenolicum]|uniref:DUF4350 domain-containing protein n=1 Tax=Sphingobium chlorophenolicum TaxID=46429 RepID=A0A081R8W1_SPHCR|nr:DUF4350 domain-containing protein [Sphingobium chlorophenolicum]KEQ51634.1 hypothetical protein BV95_04103 [Sphingobium chlorophenolicum]